LFMAFEAAFADSSFLCALVAKQDFAHAAALWAFVELTRAGRPILTTDYVIDEALTLTKVRANAGVSLALLDRIEQSHNLLCEFITPARFTVAKSFFRKHSDHGYSFTDCTSFVIMRELGLNEALTTDRHFFEAGFRMLLPTQAK